MSQLFYWYKEQERLKQKAFAFDITLQTRSFFFSNLNVVKAKQS